VIFVIDLERFLVEYESDTGSIPQALSCDLPPQTHPAFSTNSVSPTLRWLLLRYVLSPQGDFFTVNDITFSECIILSRRSVSENGYSFEERGAFTVGAIQNDGRATSQQRRLKMTPETIPKTLQELEFTRDIPLEQLEKLAALAFEVSFHEDFTIFRETDAGELLYLIKSGQVALYVSVPGKGRMTILTLGPGQILAWSSLFPSGRKTASARTVTPTEAIAFNAAQLRDAMDEDKELGYAILWRVADVVANRLKATRLQLLDIFAPSDSY
jgi:hypothetical protein